MIQKVFEHYTKQTGLDAKTTLKQLLSDAIVLNRVNLIAPLMNTGASFEGLEDLIEILDFVDPSHWFANKRTPLACELLAHGYRPPKTRWDSMSGLWKKTIICFAASSSNYRAVLAVPDPFLSSLELKTKLMNAARQDRNWSAMLSLTRTDVWAELPNDLAWEEATQLQATDNERGLLSKNNKKELFTQFVSLAVTRSEEEMLTIIKSMKTNIEKNTCSLALAITKGQNDLISPFLSDPDFPQFPLCTNLLILIACRARKLEALEIFLRHELTHGSSPLIDMNSVKLKRHEALVEIETSYGNAELLDQAIIDFF